VRNTASGGPGTGGYYPARRTGKQRGRELAKGARLDFTGSEGGQAAATTAKRRCTVTERDGADVLFPCRPPEDAKRTPEPCDLIDLTPKQRYQIMLGCYCAVALGALDMCVLLSALKANRGDETDLFPPSSSSSFPFLLPCSGPSRPLSLVPSLRRSTSRTSPPGSALPSSSPISFVSFLFFSFPVNLKVMFTSCPTDLHSSLRPPLRYHRSSRSKLVGNRTLRARHAGLCPLKFHDSTRDLPLPGRRRRRRNEHDVDDHRKRPFPAQEEGPSG
jgi:hypothetical protein